MKKRPTRVVGIDVSTEDLALACRPEPRRWRVANAPSGIAEWLGQLRRLKPALLVLEATGGWQDALVAALAVAKRPFAVVTPRQSRDVAKATGPLAKTDALDAGVIAHVAEAVHPTPRLLPDALTPQLDALGQRRRQRLEMLVAERHRMALAHPTVRDRLARQIDDLQRLIAETDAEISTLIRTTPAWRETDDVLQSTPGIGPVLSATLHAALPEFGGLNQRNIAQLVGVAPLHDASGKHAGARHLRGGRAEVRAVLSMATLTAPRGNPAINACYHRLLARGKPQNVAMTAAMRKFLTILNTRVKTRTPWNARVPQHLLPEPAR